MSVKHGGDWAGYQREYGRLPLDFSSSISPLGLPEGVRSAAAGALDMADRYPDSACGSLREKLSVYYGIDPERIVCGNGAADLIHRLCTALRPRRALLAAPEFGEYEAALHAWGAEVQTLLRRLPEGFAEDTRSLREHVRGKDLLFLSNPNNPSGLLTERRVLREILDACRGAGCTAVIDECFLDFAEEPECFSLLPELQQRQELVILKAFTKTYAMAGLRLGYALCGSAETAAALQAAGQPWPVSHPAQAAGIAALREEEYLLRLRSLITRERRRLAGALSGLGFAVVPGKANYLLFRSRDEQLEEKLRTRGVLIRDCRNYRGLGPGWYRAAIRTEEENDRLIRALEEVG